MPLPRAVTPGAVLEQRLAAAREQAARRPASASAGQAPASQAPPRWSGGEARRSPRSGQGAARDGPAVQPPGQGEVVAIHVVDDYRGVTRDFFVGRSVLLANMRYFASYLHEQAKVDISVNCDANVFELLVRAMEPGAPPPQLEERSAVSVLVAADFLGMSALVPLVTQFVALHLNEILELPIDVACVEDPVLARVAAELGLRGLAQLRDPARKVAPRLYRLQLERLLAAEGTRLGRCAGCGKVFHAARAAASGLACPAAAPAVDVRGRLRQDHRAEPGWAALPGMVEPLRRAARLSWERIFWAVWAACRVFGCSSCGRAFAGAHLSGDCRSHPTPQVAGGQPCCAARSHGVRRRYLQPLFSLETEESDGCVVGSHVPFADEPDADLLLARQSDIAAAFDALRAWEQRSRTVASSMRAPVQQPEQQQGKQPEQQQQQQTTPPLSGAALLEQPSAWYTPRSGSKLGGGRESENVDVLAPDGTLVFVGAGGRAAPAPSAIPPLGRCLLDALDCTPAVAEAPSLWALERQRDDDTVNMMQLVQALRKLRAPREK
jgi:hypothetical protein